VLAGWACCPQEDIVATTKTSTDKASTAKTGTAKASTAKTGTAKASMAKASTGKAATTKATPSATSRAKPKTGARATRKTSRAATRPTDALTLLKADHKDVRGWFDEHDRTDDAGRKQELADQICLALTVHTQIEEEIFYPAAYDALDDDDLLDEAEIEHASAKALIAEIRAGKVGEPLFDARVTVLGEYVKHHVEEEEKEMFPECRASDMDLKALGEQVARRKDELTAELA
jgi:hemerythrin superfamily protein